MILDLLYNHIFINIKLRSHRKINEKFYRVMKYGRNRGY